MPLPDGFSLRRATAADVPAYGAFLRRIFAATYGPHHPPQGVARQIEDRFNDARLRTELLDAARTLLLVEREGELLGLALLRAGAGPPAVVAGCPVEVERFYVDAQWHGGGIAAPLMEAALDVARTAGHDVAWLSVWERNPRAIRFYEKRGFHIAGRNVYVFDGQPEDDHLMIRALHDPASRSPGPGGPG